MKMHDRPIILELEENLSASRDSTTNIRLFASVKGVVQFYAIGRKGFKKSVRFFCRIKDSTGKRGDGEETNTDEESIQFYSGNKALPLFSRSTFKLQSLLYPVSRGLSPCYLPCRS